MPDLSHITVPERIDERIARYRKQYGINEEYATFFARSSYDLDGLVRRFPNIHLSFLATALFVLPKDIRRKEGVEVDTAYIEATLLPAIDRGEVLEEAARDILVEQGRTGSADLSAHRPIDGKEIRKALEAIVSEDPDAPIGALMGRAMERFKGKVAGKTISSLLREIRKKK